MKRSGITGLALGVGLGLGIAGVMAIVGGIGTIWQSFEGQGKVWASEFLIAPLPAMVLGGIVGLVVGLVLGKAHAPKPVPPPPPADASQPR
jgi:hypothetical protein